MVSQENFESWNRYRRKKPHIATKKIALASDAEKSAKNWMKNEIQITDLKFMSLFGIGASAPCLANAMSQSRIVVKVKEFVNNVKAIEYLKVSAVTGQN